MACRCPDNRPHPDICPPPGQTHPGHVPPGLVTIPDNRPPPLYQHDLHISVSLFVYELITDIDYID